LCLIVSLVGYEISSGDSERGDFCFQFLDGTYDVTVLNESGNKDATLRSVMTDTVLSVGSTDRCILTECYRFIRSSRDEEVSERAEIPLPVRIELHNERIAFVPIENFCRLHPHESSFKRFICHTDIDSIGGCYIAVDIDRYLWHALFLFHLCVYDTRNLLHDRENIRRLESENIEIFTVESEYDRCTGSWNELLHTVRDRLPEGKEDLSFVFLINFQNIPFYIFFLRFFGVNEHLEFGAVNTARVCIGLSPTDGGSEVLHTRDFQDFFGYFVHDRLGVLNGTPIWSKHHGSESRFVKWWQSLFSWRYIQHRGKNDTGKCGNEHHFRISHTKPDRSYGEIFYLSDKRGIVRFISGSEFFFWILVFFGSFFYVFGKKERCKHWYKCEWDDKRREKCYNIRGSDRCQKFPINTRQEEERNEHERDENRCVHDRITHFFRGFEYHFERRFLLFFW